VEYVTETARVKELILQHGKAVVKAPWSSSGRGVKYVSAEDFRTAGDYPTFERWVANMIYHQGGVTVEPLYNKVRDFAMEFEMKDGKVLYRVFRFSIRSRTPIRAMCSALKMIRWK
jgi:hypothetical protein